MSWLVVNSAGFNTNQRPLNVAVRIAILVLCPRPFSIVLLHPSLVHYVPTSHLSSSLDTTVRLVIIFSISSFCLHFFLFHTTSFTITCHYYRTIILLVTRTPSVRFHIVWFTPFQLPPSGEGNTISFIITLLPLSII